MSTNRSVFTALLLLSAAVFQLLAQQTEPDHKQVEEIKVKAQSGDADSEYRLGLRYYDGKGVAKDFSEAVKWFRKAAEQNFSRAQDALGLCYRKGEGVVKDEGEGVKWYRKAAEQNFAPAQYNLGACYDLGYGVAKDLVEAVMWYRKAAEQNFAPAQYNLGNCYVEGEGVVKDEIEGYKWILLAAAQGNQNGRKAVAILESHLTREQIAKGQKLARNFKPQKVPASEGDSSMAVD